MSIYRVDWRILYQDHIDLFIYSTKYDTSLLVTGYLSNIILESMWDKGIIEGLAKVAKYSYVRARVLSVYSCVDI